MSYCNRFLLVTFVKNLSKEICKNSLRYNCTANLTICCTVNSGCVRMQYTLSIVACNFDDAFVIFSICTNKYILNNLGNWLSTRTLLPSSGLGYFTVLNSGSGSIWNIKVVLYDFCELLKSTPSLPDYTRKNWWVRLRPRCSLNNARTILSSRFNNTCWIYNADEYCSINSCWILTNNNSCYNVVETGADNILWNKLVNSCQQWLSNDCWPWTTANNGCWQRCSWEYDL